VLHCPMTNDDKIACCAPITDPRSFGRGFFYAGTLPGAAASNFQARRVLGLKPTPS